jgi:orotate phosphoribosyltransferase
MADFDQAGFNQFILDNGVYGFFENAITLKSGRQSHFYANFRTVAEDVWLMEQLVGHVLSFIESRNIPVDTFYGVPEGATKLGILTQFHRARMQSEYGPGSHVLAMGRAKPKEHGAPQDRFFVGTPRGKVVVLEDATTTAGSALKTLDFLREVAIEVSAMVSLTNRMEMRDDGRSVREAVEEKGVSFYHMSTALEILPRLYEKLQPGEEIARAIEEEYSRYGVEPIKLL